MAGATEYIDLLVEQSATGMKVLHGTHHYSTRANWKLLPVNVIDGSHFLPTHVTYLEYLKDRGSDLSRAIDYYHETDLGNGHTVYEFESIWGRPIALSDPAWGEDVNAQLQDIYKKLAARLGRLILTDIRFTISEVLSRVNSTPNPPFLIVLDEFGSYATPDFLVVFEKSRYFLEVPLQFNII